MALKYVLVSLPLSAFDATDQDEAVASLRSTLGTDAESVTTFNIPEFKIGTLDALVQHADDLARLDVACQGAVAKVADSLKTVLEGDEDRLSQYKVVNDKPTDQGVTGFSWNKMRYRADRPLGDLVDVLQKELATVDNDVKTKFNHYQTVKTSLSALQRRQTGNLVTKSLAPIVDPTLLIHESEYLETHFVVVPLTGKKEFLRSYETVSPMVVPRSASEVACDDEFILFAVATFKKYSADFIQKCRELKWTPRLFKYVEGGKEEEQRELDRAASEERKLYGEALRLGRTSWSETVMIWMHVLTLRVFVEAVLRYGLPLDYASSLIKIAPKLVPKAKKALDSAYSYLGGNAVRRDKRGRIAKDDVTLSSEMAAAGLGSGDGNEYTAYVYYEFELP